MFRRMWQGTMIGMARSRRVKDFMQTSRATSFLSDQYVAGKSASAGVMRARELMAQHNIRSSLFYMGEYVDQMALVEENVANKIAVADELVQANLDVHVSLDPTQIGHHIDPGLVMERARMIAGLISRHAERKPGVHCLMFDMEDAALNDPTIRIHNHLQNEGYLVALTLQAYLKRTFKDMGEQVARGSRVRLVKGAFAAGSDIAYTRDTEIKGNTRKLIDLMFSKMARTRGFYPIIATHDTALHAYAVAKARQNGWQQGEYEFEMLLGVREDVARELAASGERVRLYVPFGQNWWPHAVRRIGENPKNAWLLARSLFN